MLAKPLRTKRQRASAERCVRPLGAMIAMATPIVKASERSSAGRIFASRFTKRQVRYRGGYKVLSTSGNCWSFFVSLLCREGSWERLELPLHAGSLFPPRSALLLPSATQGDH